METGLGVKFNYRLRRVETWNILQKNAISLSRKKTL